MKKGIALLLSLLLLFSCGCTRSTPNSEPQDDPPESAGSAPEAAVEPPVEELPTQPFCVDDYPDGSFGAYLAARSAVLPERITAPMDALLRESAAAYSVEDIYSEGGLVSYIEASYGPLSAEDISVIDGLQALLYESGAPATPTQTVSDTQTGGEETYQSPDGAFTTTLYHADTLHDGAHIQEIATAELLDDTVYFDEELYISIDRVFDGPFTSVFLSGEAELGRTYTMSDTGYLFRNPDAMLNVCYNLSQNNGYGYDSAGDPGAFGSLFFRLDEWDRRTGFVAGYIAYTDSVTTHAVELYFVTNCLTSDEAPDLMDEYMADLPVRAGSGSSSGLGSSSSSYPAPDFSYPSTTAQEKTCPFCGGRGKIDCSSCGGDGYNSVWKSYGYGVDGGTYIDEPCPICSYGQVRCNYCYGDGIYGN